MSDRENDTSTSSLDSNADSMSSASVSCSSIIIDDSQICAALIEDCGWNCKQLSINKIESTKKWGSWCLRARVDFKSEVRYWSKGQSEGKYFSMHFADGTGTIRAIAFNDACDSFFPLIKLNEEYYIRKFEIKPVNPAYKKMSHEFELFLESYTVIKPVTHHNASNILPPVKIWTLIDFAFEVKENPHCGVFHVEASILYINTNIDEVVYKGCPLEACKKKVVSTNNKDEWYCDKCQVKYPLYQDRFMLKIVIADWTGQLKVTLFKEAEKFLGITANNIVKIHNTDFEKYESYFNKFLQSYMFVLEGEMNEFNDENRVNGVVVHHYKIDYRKSIRRTFKDLKRLTK